MDFQAWYFTSLSVLLIHRLICWLKFFITSFDLCRLGKENYSLVLTIFLTSNFLCLIEHNIILHYIELQGDYYAVPQKNCCKTIRLNFLSKHVTSQPQCFLLTFQLFLVAVIFNNRMESKHFLQFLPANMILVAKQSLLISNN